MPHDNKRYVEELNYDNDAKYQWLIKENNTK